MFKAKLLCILVTLRFYSNYELETERMCSTTNLHCYSLHFHIQLIHQLGFQMYHYFLPEIRELKIQRYIFILAIIDECNQSLTWLAEVYNLNSEWFLTSLDARCILLLRSESSFALPKELLVYSVLKYDKNLLIQY